MLGVIGRQLFAKAVPKRPQLIHLADEGFSEFDQYLKYVESPPNQYVSTASSASRRLESDCDPVAMICRFADKQQIVFDVCPLPLVDNIHYELLRTLGKPLLRDYWLSGGDISFGPHDLVDTTEACRPILIARPNFSISSAGGEAPWNDVKDLVWRAILESDAFARYKREIEAIAGPMQVCRF